MMKTYALPTSTNAMALAGSAILLLLSEPRKRRQKKRKVPPSMSDLADQPPWAVKNGESIVP